MSALISSIYKFLDQEKYEEVIKLCEGREAKKIPHAQALLSYALGEVGRGAEAAAIARELLQSRNPEEKVLNTLCFTFKGISDYESLVKCYDLLLQLNPLSEQHAQQLFFALGRLGDLKRMQKTAQLLYKGMGKRHYLFWTVCSMLSNERSDMVFLLAERMLRKLLYEVFPETRPGFEELRVFIDVLMQQKGREREALKAFDELSVRPAGTAINDQDALMSLEQGVAALPLRQHELRAELLQKVGDSVEEKAELLRILILFPDQYSAHSRLVELAITKGAEAITEHLSFLRAQQQIHPLLRGIRLAEIDLTLKTDTAMSSETGALKLLCVYVDLFSNRQCCFSDLRPFLESLATSSEGTTALFSLSEWLEKQANNVLTAISSFNTESDNRQLPDLLVQLASFFKLRLFIFHIIESKEQPPLFLTSLPSTLMSVHNNTRNRCPAPIGGEREVQPGDELLMTVLSYCRELRRRQSSGHSFTHLDLQSAFLQVAIALHGSSCSPFSFSLKLEALDPLRHLGCGEALLTNFRALGVRYIQNDSLSYLILPSLLECGLYDEALKLNRQVLAFQLVAIKDANDMSVRAYQSKSYGSIFEMGAFMLKCTRSLQLALSKSDTIMLELIKVKSLEESELYMSQLLAGSLPESEPVLAFSQGGGEEYLASLSDNMDYTVLVRPDYARAEEERDAHLRRLASERRIRVICYLALILDCVRSGANDSRQSKWSAALSSELLVVVDETCWSASVEGGCSQEVTKSIADVTISFCQLCCGDEVKDGLLGAQLDSIQSQLSIPRSASSEQVGILDVQWLRESSLFLSTVGCWVIPMIAHKIMSVTCSNVIRSSAAMLLNAMEALESALDIAQRHYSNLSPSELSPFYRDYSQQNVGETVFRQLEGASSDVCRQMIECHSACCQRLIETTKIKIALLRTCLLSA